MRYFSLGLGVALTCFCACGEGGGDSAGDNTPSGGSGGTATGSGGVAGPSTGGQDAQSGGQSSGGTEAGGTSSSGGVGGGAVGGSGGGGAESGGTGGQVDPCLQSTEAMLPGSARSATFSGTDSEYAELYNQLCVTKDDCVAPCTERGGTAEFCAEHVCVDSTNDYCLPPTKWRNVINALQENGMQSDSAESSLDPGTVGFQDRLVLEDFGFAVPVGAKVVGVSALVKRAYSSSDPVVDYSVRLVRDGKEVGTDLKRNDAWSEEVFEEAEYGGEAELWGEEWSPAQVNSKTFGIAIGALPLAGGRAYIDAVRLVVHYDVCE